MENENGGKAQNKTILTPLEFNFKTDATPSFLDNEHQSDFRSCLFYATDQAKATKADIDGFDGKEASLAVHRLAKQFPADFSIENINSNLTKNFLGQVDANEEWLKRIFGEYSPRNKPDPLWKRAWQENTSLQKTVIDALLIRAEKESLAKNNPEHVDIIRQARELLRLPNYPFLSPYYQGTSSAALSGIEQANGRILSLKKLSELGIARRTGEGFLLGASAEASNSGISVSTTFEIGDKYSLLCRDEYRRDPEKIKNELNSFQYYISSFEKELKEPEEYEGQYLDISANIEGLRQKVQIIKTELGLLESQPLNDDQPFPIIFGLKDLEVTRPENDPFGSVRVGHEIDLHSKLQAIYVPINKGDYMKEWCQKNGITEMQVYSLEAVKLVRLMNPTWDWIRRKTDMENRNLRGETIAAEIR